MISTKTGQPRHPSRIEDVLRDRLLMRHQLDLPLMAKGLRECRGDDIDPVFDGERSRPVPKVAPVQNRVTDSVATLEELAERFRVTPRWLRQFVKQHKIPFLGSTKQMRFEDADTVALKEALRCHSKSPDEKTAAPSRSKAGSSFPTARGSAYERLLSRRTSSSPAKKPPRSKRGS
jgi:hypothetical protein